MRKEEKAMRDRFTIVVSLLCILMLILIVLIASAMEDKLSEPQPPEVNAAGLCTVTVVYLPQPTETEVIAMARAMSGECYESEYEDMLRVGMAICNRADYNGELYSFPDTIEGVCAQTGQIFGYDPNRQPKDIYIRAAREVLANWYGIKNGELRPWEHGIMFWSGFGGTKNTFREDY